MLIIYKKNQCNYFLFFFKRVQLNIYKEIEKGININGNIYMLVIYNVKQRKTLWGSINSKCFSEHTDQPANHTYSFNQLTNSFRHNYMVLNRLINY